MESPASPIVGLFELVIDCAFDVPQRHRAGCLRRASWAFRRTERRWSLTQIKSATAGRHSALAVGSKLPRAFPCVQHPTSVPRRAQ